jgi:predicted glycoside hydrolase/deacetylase ChbG (UPF0249 family)
MPANKYLIVNADDFGQSPGVNRGIIAAHERGVVTSASLMVRWPAAAEAAAYARAHPRLAVGLHLDLGEWACRDGTWAPLYEVVPQDDAAAVAGEVARQLDAFRRLVGRDPTHLDSHQHAHLKEPAKGLTTELARRLGVPLRGLDPVIRYCGGFYGQTGDGTPLPEILSPEGLVRILAELPPGVTELGCHPGEAGDLDTMYRDERAREVEVLCGERVRAALAEMGIELCSFAALPGAARASAL